MILPKISSWFKEKPSSSNVKSLHVQVKHIDVMRAEVFFEDMSLVLNEESEVLNINSLVYLLYEDFLLQIRSEFTPHLMIEQLEEKRDRYLNEEFISESTNYAYEKWTRIKIPIKRTLSARGEIFLHDLCMVSPSFEMSLDELVSILFMDFMIEIRKGNQKKLMKLLLKRLQDWE